jgi:hypothetical protein
VPSKPVHSRGPSFEDSIYDNPGFVRPSNSPRKVPPQKPSSQAVILPEATDEIQYLDLDLESDTNSSPRTPSFVTVLTEKASPSTPKDSTTTVTASGHVIVASPSNNSSTVYKTVDFVKTSALNKLRLDPELSAREKAHRSNQ